MSVDCMNVKPGMEVAGLSDVGCQRDNNEDSYLYWEPAVTANSIGREDWP